MLRKLPGYVFLSLFSFFCFTLVFHSAASAQTGLFITEPDPSLPMDEHAFSEESVHIVAAEDLPPSYFEPTEAPPQSYLDLNSDSKVEEPTEPTPSTPTPTIEATATPTPTNTPTPMPITPSATPTPLHVLAASTDIETLFSTYADTYHVSKDQLKKIAKCESSFNAQATNGDYTGMFQFATLTWQNTRTAMGADGNPELRKDAGESIRTAAYMLSKGQENAWANCK